MMLFMGFVLILIFLLVKIVTFDIHPVLLPARCSLIKLCALLGDVYLSVEGTHLEDIIP